ncbi:MAG: V-type ATPase subunit [Oscillospiraceae bacterium]|jgi:vacuolar-type H+-ATPase subunit C/Vma6|nr:V-type ATPase subunit [Oscillospiraceae bacterium]
MLKAQMTYGALRTKVMAMYGKMLAGDDWQSLGACRGLTEICAFLRNHRGWRATLAGLPLLPTEEVLAAAVRRRCYVDYEKLYGFLPSGDKRLLRFLLCRAEYAFILAAVRERNRLESLPKSLELTDFVRKNSEVDFDALERSANFQAVLGAVRGSLFEAPLRMLKPDQDTGWPDFREVGIALESAYFKTVFSYIVKKYKGLGRKKLADTFGLEADLLNITGLLRLHRSFPASLPQARELLLPVSCRLNPKLLLALTEAGTEGEAWDIIGRSPFGGCLQETDPDHIEDFYYKSLERIGRRLLRAPEPDFSAALGLVILQELECKKLNRVIEAVSGGCA